MDGLEQLQKLACEEARGRRSEIEGDDPGGTGRWTSRGRAGAAAEIAWEEATNVEARSKGKFW